jgi:glycosyltransferase involved in cell wall biosynthesis
MSELEKTPDGADHDRIPPLSIIMPAYNAGPYIDRAVQSILGQTFTDFELIIYVDESLDDTSAIAHSYALEDDRVCVVDSDERLGLSVALNRAIEGARGEYIGRMDADDIALPQRFEVLMDLIRSNSDLVVVGSGTLHIDGDDNVLGISMAGPTSIAEFRSLRDQGEITIVLDGTAVMSHKIFRLVGGYDPELAAAPEVDLHCRMAAHGVILSVEEPLLLYRLHPSSSVATGFFEGRSVHRFVEAREKAMLRGEVPPTYQSHVESEGSAPTWRRASIRLADLGQFHYRTAGVRLSEGRKGAAVVSIGRAFVANPRFVVERAWQRRFSPAARDQMQQISHGS